MDEKDKTTTEQQLSSEDTTLKNEKTYDRVLTTMVTRMTEFVIPLVNEVFVTPFTWNASVEIRSNKHVIPGRDGGLNERTTDAYVCLSEMFDQQLLRKSFHFECETWFDNSVVLRVAEYGSVTAIEEAELKDGEVVLHYPLSAIIFLRPDDRIRSSMRITLCLPNDTVASYDVPAIQIRDYSIEEIIEKKLFLILPFYLFRFADRFHEIEADENERNVFFELLDKINLMLENLQQLKEITAYQKRLIQQLLLRVTKKLTLNYPNIKKGVDEHMSGELIITDADIILEKGIEQGKKEGIEQGKKEGIEQGKKEGIEQGKELGAATERQEKITQMLNDGKTPEAIADFCKYPLSLILQVQESLLAG